MTTDDGEDGHGPVLVAAVGTGVGAPIDHDQVVDVVRAAVEGVVQRAMGIELTWGVSAFLRSDDLGAWFPASPTGADGLDWEFVRGRLRHGQPQAIAVSAQSAVMRADFDRDPDPARINPRIYVADVHVSFPFEAPWATGPLGGLAVRAAMSRWAMYGGGERLDWIAPALHEWVVETSAALDADTGYVAADEHRLSDAGSDWERQHHLSPGYRDLRRRLWGFGWGTLLGPTQLAAVGGVERLREASDRIRPLPGGRAWVDLGEEPAAVPPEALRRLRVVLDPVLRRPEHRPDGVVEP